jgi:hypothetical protein
VVLADTPAAIGTACELVFNGGSRREPLTAPVSPSVLVFAFVAAARVLPVAVGDLTAGASILGIEKHTRPSR